MYLSNYATKADLKGATSSDISNLAAKSDLNSLKADLDEIDVDKLKTIPADWCKLSNVIDNDVVKKSVYDKLFIKGNAIGTNEFLSKAQYNVNKLGTKKKIEDAKKRYLILVSVLKKKNRL